MSNLISALESALPLFLLAPLALVIVIAYVRLLGLRSFSKMTSFDFVATVAIGSVLAQAATSVELAAYVQAVLAIGILFATQYCLAKGRLKSSMFKDVISNKPILLFSKGHFDELALAQTRVTKGDVWGKVREANALQIERIQAVVLEPTGDISVLHGDVVDQQVIDNIQPSPLKKMIDH